MKEILVIVDPLNDFCEGGSLEVPDGDAIMAHINWLMEETDFAAVIVVQDWHPENHISFASRHGTPEFVDNVVRQGNGENVTLKMWPTHCVAGTEGAAIHKDLNQAPITHIVRKGIDSECECYSGVVDELGKETGLVALIAAIQEQYFGEQQRVRVVGLALKFCVQSTARDLNNSSFNVAVDLEGCRCLSDIDEQEEIIDSMKEVGIEFLNEA